MKAPAPVVEKSPKLDLAKIELIRRARNIQDLISQLCGSMSVMTLGFGGDKDYGKMIDGIVQSLVEFADYSNKEIHQYEGTNNTDIRNHRQRLYQAWCSLSPSLLCVCVCGRSIRSSKLNPGIARRFARRLCRLSGLASRRRRCTR